jgi:hypothetical protein
MILYDHFEVQKLQFARRKRVHINHGSNTYLDNTH